MAGPVINPSTPYIGQVQGGLKDGMSIIISGHLEHDNHGFLISLQEGRSIDPRNDAAFVFNPRFKENQVVRNSLKSGKWGTEERSGGFPFLKGYDCEVTIHVNRNVFKVSVDGIHFCDYEHRIPKHRVTHISVEQGIDIHTVTFKKPGNQHATLSEQHHQTTTSMMESFGKLQAEMFSGAMFASFSGTPAGAYPGGVAGATPFNPPGPPAGAYPGGGAGAPPFNMPGLPAGAYPGGGAGATPFNPYSQPGPPAGAYPGGGAGAPPYNPYPQPGPPAGAYPGGGAGDPICNPPMPFSQAIPGGLFQTSFIFINGIPNPNPTRFSIYIQKGPQHEPYDIAMAFDARFCYSADINKVVCNSRQNGYWGAEERKASYYPFTPNANFEMIIVVKKKGYTICVNNQKLLKFHHRFPPFHMDTLNITGDVRLTQVRFQ